MVKEAAPASQMVLVGNILFDTYCKCQHISEAEWGYSEEPILDATAPPRPRNTDRKFIMVAGLPWLSLKDNQYLPTFRSTSLGPKTQPK